jgi:predicted RNase H-like nuclease
MTAVLGVDAAWTAKNASGYALVEKIGGAWRLKAAAPDGDEFSRRCGLNEKGQGIAQALRCAKHVLNDRLPDLVAVDMPLSRQEITGRRASDIGVSKRFGAAKCSTHSPSAERPGKVSGPFRAACQAVGYEHIVAAGRLPALSLAEVYPHPALLRLMGARSRVPYKVGKTKTYWPEASPEKRRAAVLDSLRNIAEALETVIVGVKREVVPRLEGTKSLASLKPAEDMIDAIICAWIGATILESAAEPIGDIDSAIWIPLPLPLGAGVPGLPRSARNDGSTRRAKENL